MGRKRNPNNNYFGETEENALKQFIQAEDEIERNKIFNAYLLKPFNRMVESIIRRYKLYVPEEDFEDTYKDTIGFMMSKLHYFKPDSGYKGYSYCGTICKNYLIYKVNKAAKMQKVNQSYDLISNEIDESPKYSYEEEDSQAKLLAEIISTTCDKIEEIIKRKEEYLLTENEIKVGRALITLMRHWDELFIEMGSVKFNKSAILMFLREETGLVTKEIRASMKKYKIAYLDTKDEVFEH